MAKKPNNAPHDARFLELWRDLENTLREDGPCTVQDLERSLESQSHADDASRLRICRQIRNYLTHDGPGLVEATDAMCAFVGIMIHEVQRARGTVADHKMTPAKYGYLTPDDGIDAAGRQMSAKKRLDALVLDSSKKPLGIFGPRAMAAAIDGWHKLNSIRDAFEQNLLDPVPTVFSSDPSKTAPEHKCAVIDAKGVCVGVWHPDRGWS